MSTKGEFRRFTVLEKAAIARGLREKAPLATIAADTGLSVDQVRTYVSRIYRIYSWPEQKEGGR